MVLENATASDTSFTNELPSSDVDPYASSSTDDGMSGQYKAQVDLARLPRRFSLIGQRDHPDFMINGINEQAKFAQGILQRPLKQEEVDALAFHFAKSIRIASYGSPMGLVMGSVLAWRSNKQMKFPGWSPFKEGSRFSKDAFGPLRGQMARLAWQSSRLSAYWLIGSILGQIFFGSYALSVSLAGRATDPRLKDFSEALRRRQQSGLGREATGQIGNQEAGPKGNETYEMARQRRDAQDMWKRRREQAMGQQKSGGQADDASPTGGMFADEYMDTKGSSGFMGEDEVRQQADSRLNASRERRPQPSNEQSTRASRQSTAEDSSPRTSGSSWDRLRQGAMSGEQKQSSFRGMQPSESAGSRASARGGDNATTGDSFSFSKSDEDRQLAKSQAQSEFDRMVEREREGRDTGEGGGKRGRW